MHKVKVPGDTSSVDSASGGGIVGEPAGVGNKVGSALGSAVAAGLVGWPVSAGEAGTPLATVVGPGVAGDVGGGGVPPHAAAVRSNATVAQASSILGAPRERVHEP
jgi:hypothetical protein